MAYRVSLPVFSGPMDLLLHLVKQQEVDIHEVQISTILASYLAHLDVLESLDLADIGEFAVMASTLMEIKSRELLPREEDVDVEEDFDPRDDLIRRLLEYKRFRDLSRRLERLSGRRAQMVPMSLPVPEALKDADKEPELDVGEIGIWDLTEAFAKLLAETGGEIRVEVDTRNVRYYTQVLLERLPKGKERPFRELFEPKDGRMAMIGTLIAMLEMMKQGLLRANQPQCADEITVVYVGPEGLTLDELMARQHQEAAAEAEAAAAQDAARGAALSDAEAEAQVEADGPVGASESAGEG